MSDPFSTILHAFATSDTDARAWCLDMARRFPHKEIRPHGTPYLTRYFLAGWSPLNPAPGPSVYLHRFVASDPNDSVHSHPWTWAMSVILVGGYREIRCTPEGDRTVRLLLPGAVNVLEAGARHRIELLTADCWTLMLAGSFGQPWGFFPACE